MDKNKGKASGDGSGDWWEMWRPHVRGMRAALIAEAAEQEIRELLSACLADYASHIGGVTTEEVLATVSGIRHSPLEAAFLWLGGWRPTAAIVLVYSIMGVQVNEETQQPALGPQLFHCVPLLSERQLSRINSLQIQSRRAEADISDRLAVIQMLIPDEELVAALNLGGPNFSSTADMPQARQLVHTKLTNIRELLVEADQLRLQTLQELFLLLSPVQGARCCLASYELVFALKTLGNSALALVQVPRIPPAAIPVPVPVILAEASTSMAALPCESLPLLLPVDPEGSQSLLPLSPVPIPLIVRRLRSAESLTEAQIFANAFPVLVPQQTSAPTVFPCSPPPQDMLHSQTVDSPIIREGFSAGLPPTFQAQASELSPAASVCSSISCPCPDPIILITAVSDHETSAVPSFATEDLPRHYTRSFETVDDQQDQVCPSLGSLNLEGEFGVPTPTSSRPEIISAAARAAGTRVRSEVGTEELVERMSPSGHTADLASSSMSPHDPGDGLLHQ